MNNMKMVTIGGLALLTLILSGCVVAMGNRDGTPRKGAGTTLGQELIDLKKARDQNVISEDEYAAQRQKLMDDKAKW